MREASWLQSAAVSWWGWPGRSATRIVSTPKYHDVKTTRLHVVLSKPRFLWTSRWWSSPRAQISFKVLLAPPSQRSKKSNHSLLLVFILSSFLRSFPSLSSALFSFLFSFARLALGYGLDDRGSRVLFAAGAGNFSLHHRVQNGSGAHPASYPMGTVFFFLGVKRPGREADHLPPSSAEVKECLELYIHSPNTPSWRGA
jgi:hypothetical protein